MKQYFIGASFVELLQLVFIVLKLTKVIEWSWWWVLAPTWMPWVLFIFAILFLIWWIKK